jgi:hypothetical protein
MNFESNFERAAVHRPPHDNAIGAALRSISIPCGQSEQKDTVSSCRHAKRAVPPAMRWPTSVAPSMSVRRQFRG